MKDNPCQVLDPKDLSQERFDEILEDILYEQRASQLLAISGIYEILAEHYNNEVLKRWEAEEEEDAFDAYEGRLWADHGPDFAETY